MARASGLSEPLDATLTRALGEARILRIEFGAGTRRHLAALGVRGGAVLAALALLMRRGCAGAWSGACGFGRPPAAPSGAARRASRRRRPYPAIRRRRALKRACDSAVPSWKEPNHLSQGTSRLP